MFEKYPFLADFKSIILNIDDTKSPIKITIKRNVGFKEIREIQHALKINDVDGKVSIQTQQHYDVKTIAFMSGKGGVGKSYVASMYAQIQSETQRVLLLDLDIYGYSIPKTFDCYDEVKMIDDKIIPIKYSDNLDIISTQYFIKDFKNQAVIWRGPKLNQLMDLMINHVDFSNYDLVVIDTPPTTGDIILNINNFFNEVNYYVVTTPRELDQYVSLRSVDVGQQLGFNFLGYIVNQSFYQYDGQELMIFGDDYLSEVKDHILCKLCLNNDEYNYNILKSIK